MSTTAMYQSLLATQWKHQRTELTLLAIAAALIGPVYLWPATAIDIERLPGRLIAASDVIGTFGAWIAVITGVLLAARPYVLDAQTRHIYALSLPVPRQRYALLRVAAGITLVLVPAAGFLIGSLLAAQAVPTPPMVQAYPVALAIRFVLAASMAFALGFGIIYGIGRRTLRWVLIVALILIGFEVVGQLALGGSLTAPIWETIAERRSPLRVFMSRWMLFDV